MLNMHRLLHFMEKVKLHFFVTFKQKLARSGLRDNNKSKNSKCFPKVPHPNHLTGFFSI